MKMKICKEIGLLWILLLFTCGESGHILFFHPVATHSHLVTTVPIAYGLTARGHNVTFITPQLPKMKSDSRIIKILPEKLLTFMDSTIGAEFDIKSRISKKRSLLPFIVDTLGKISCEIILNSPEFEEWMSTEPQVDLIYADILPECALGLGLKLNSKVAVFNTLPFYVKYLDAFGVQDESNAVGNFEIPGFDRTSFFHRVGNELFNLLYFAINKFHKLSYRSLLKDNLQLKDVPDMDTLYKNVCLVMSAADVVSEHQRSLPPMFVNVGGTHLKDDVQPLRQEIENFISTNSSVGFIYISLGTVAKSSDLPEHILDAFMFAIKSHTHINFLWKWESAKVPVDTPSNLYMSQWFTQQDVLGHPKIKGFVTQAGRLSMQEAVANAVPVIAIPILTDQDYNANRLQELGAGQVLDISQFTKTTLHSAISNLLMNETMKENAKRLSALAKDTPMRPVETAVWWTEYILRNNDFSHLKPLGNSQTWYQRRHLDVWFFLLLCAIMFFFNLYYLGRFFARLVVSFLCKANKLPKIKIN